METDPQVVGARIRAERERLKLSLGRVAEMTGLSKTYLLRLESGDATNPSLDVLRRIADALDVTVADLLGRASMRFSEPRVDDLPPSLLAFADQAGIPERELFTLASIRWRKGEEPRTPERWRFVHDALNASTRIDELED